MSTFWLLISWINCYYSMIIVKYDFIVVIGNAEFDYWMEYSSANLNNRGIITGGCFDNDNERFCVVFRPNARTLTLRNDINLNGHYNIQIQFDGYCTDNAQLQALYSIDSGITWNVTHGICCQNQSTRETIVSTLPDNAENVDTFKIQFLQLNDNGICYLDDVIVIGSTLSPTIQTITPTNLPTNAPTINPTIETFLPTNIPTNLPTNEPTSAPTNTSTNVPTKSPTATPTKIPTVSTKTPTTQPTKIPTVNTKTPTTQPTLTPTTC